MRFSQLLAGPLLLALPFLANAQAQAAASVVGTVYDSVRGRPLSGARIRVDITDIVASADNNGAFRLEGIPPGAHYLGVEHPVLDTLTISLGTPAISLNAGETKTISLATPSSRALIAQLCSETWRRRGPAILIGRVREADSGEPAAGAKVSLVSYALEISAGVRSRPMVREAAVGHDGSYRLCGLDAQFRGRVQVLRGNLTSGEITVSAGDDLVVMRSMSIASPGAAVAVRVDSGGPAALPVLVGTARLSGKVVDAGGRPLASARVQLQGTTHVATTRANGEFTLDSLPPGTHRYLSGCSVTPPRKWPSICPRPSQAR